MGDQADEDRIRDHQQKLRSRYSWNAVRPPKVWKPKVIGEELIGNYKGTTTRSGKFGDYRVVLLTVPLLGDMAVSGVNVISAIDSALLQNGQLLCVRWLGYVTLCEGRKMNKFEVLVAEEHDNERTAGASPEHPSGGEELPQRQEEAGGYH